MFRHSRSLLTSLVAVALVFAGPAGVSAAGPPGERAQPAQPPPGGGPVAVNPFPFSDPNRIETQDIARRWTFSGIGLFGEFDVEFDLDPLTRPFKPRGEILPQLFPDPEAVTGNAMALTSFQGDGTFVVPVGNGGFATVVDSDYIYSPYTNTLLVTQVYTTGTKDYALVMKGTVNRVGLSDYTLTGSYNLYRIDERTSSTYWAPISWGAFTGDSSLLGSPKATGKDLIGKDLIGSSAPVASAGVEVNGPDADLYTYLDDVFFPDDLDFGEAGAYPIDDVTDPRTFLDSIQRPLFLEDGNDYPFQEYRLADVGGGLSLSPGLFDKGVNFTSIRFSGFALDSGSNAPFFRVELQEAPPGAPGVPLAELAGQDRRFKEYFTEAMALTSQDIRVSVEAAPDVNGQRTAKIVVPDPLRATRAGRAMVDADITMKRDFLADVVRGQEDVVGDGVLGAWTAELAASPDYAALVQGGLPTFDLSVRARIVSGPAAVKRGFDAESAKDLVRVADVPLDLETFVDTCRLSPGYEDKLPVLQPLVDRLCAGVAQRMGERKTAFVAKLNSAPEYAELRLVHEAVVQATLYKSLLTGGGSSPYGSFDDTGVVPAKFAVAGAFPEAEYLARTTATAGVDRATAPCATTPQGSQLCFDSELRYEIFGGVSFDAPVAAPVPLPDPAAVARVSVPSLGVLNQDGLRQASTGTVLPLEYAEYAIASKGDPRSGPVTVTVANAGQTDVAQQYLVATDIATDAAGTVLSSRPVKAQLSPAVAIPGKPEVITLTCPTCGQPVPGAVVRRLEITMDFGKVAEDGVFDTSTEFNPVNRTTVVYQHPPRGLGEFLGVTIGERE